MSAPLRALARLRCGLRLRAPRAEPARAAACRAGAAPAPAGLRTVAPPPQLSTLHRAVAAARGGTARPGGGVRLARRRYAAAATSGPAAADDPTLPPRQRCIVDVLRERGLLDAVTNEAALRSAAGAGPLRAYCGFDPTAPSLHLGNLLGIIVLAWFQRCGHTPVALVGGATGRVGDPSGKSTERPVMDEATLEANVAGIGALLSALLPTGDAGLAAPLVLNNMAWFGSMTLLDFLRDVGKHARVGVMLSKDSVKARMGTPGAKGEAGEGMSYTEFTYQLLQAYDFSYLFKEHGVSVQIGGSDQWGNITAGTDLIRRVQQREGAIGLTFPLLLRSDGKKFGKSEEGAIWLSADRLSPYKFYQYMFAVPDADVGRFMRRLTFVPLAEIEALERAMADPSTYEVNSAQKRLAAEVTRFVHGEAGLAAALRATQGLAPGAATVLDAETLESLASDVPTVELPRSAAVGVTVAELAVASGLQPSKGAAKKLIKGGGVYINNAKVADEAATVAEADAIDGRLILLACGKKNKVLVRISG